MPFHGEVLADVAAHQWWMGGNPEALRKENADRFNINKVPLSSNLIALVCSAVRNSDVLSEPGLSNFIFPLTVPDSRRPRGGFQGQSDGELR